MFIQVDAEEALLAKNIGESYITYLTKTGLFQPRYIHH
jgi:hypothetical protein